MSTCSSSHAFKTAPVLLALPLIAAAQTADTIWTNGKIITVDSRFSTVEAMAAGNGRFVAVGTDAEVRKLAGPSTRIIDLHGKTVVPGFEDSHLHGAGGGPGVDLSGARSLADLYAAIRRRVEASKPGDL